VPPSQETEAIKPILLTQIMGLAMGALPEELGLDPGFSLTPKNTR
jgi:heterodisulfide reductase subunit B